MADNPFDQFDAPAAMQGNPFDRFDAPAPRPQEQPGFFSRWKTDIGNAARGSEQLAMEGEQQVHSGQPLQVATGLGKEALGSLGILTSPITGSVRAIVGDPTRNVARGAGAPEWAANMLGNTTEDIASIYAPEATVGTLGRAGEVAGNLVRPSASTAQRLADFDKSGITPNVPAVTQSPTAGMVANAMRNTPIVGDVITSGVNKNIGEAAERANEIAGQFGDAMTPREGGEALQEGYAQFKGEAAATPSIERAKATPTRNIGFIPKSEALYNAIPIENAAPAQVNNTLNALTALRTKFPSNPELGALLQNPKFAKFAEALTPRTEQVPAELSSVLDVNGRPYVLNPAGEVTKGGLNWQDLRNFRSFVGRQMRQPSGELGMGPDDWRNLYGAISRDIEGTASAQGPEALKAFNRANSYYSAGLDRLNDAMAYIDKATSPESTFAKFADKASAQGRSADLDRLRATLKSMPDEFRDDAVAATIRNLGTPVPSQGGANPANFSVGTWATNYAKIGSDAKDALFGPIGTDRRDSLEALSRSINAIKNVERLGNPSGTARQAITAGLIGGAAVMPFKVIPSMIGEYLGARALMSPSIARWMANAARTTTDAGWAAQLSRLGTLSRKYPYLQPVVQALQPSPNHTAQ